MAVFFKHIWVTLCVLLSIVTHLFLMVTVSNLTALHKRVYMDMCCHRSNCTMLRQSAEHNYQHTLITLGRLQAARPTGGHITVTSGSITRLSFTSRTAVVGTVGTVVMTVTLWRCTDQTVVLSVLGKFNLPHPSLTKCKGRGTRLCVCVLGFCLFVCLFLFFLFVCLFVLFFVFCFVSFFGCLLSLFCLLNFKLYPSKNTISTWHFLPKCLFPCLYLVLFCCCCCCCCCCYRGCWNFWFEKCMPVCLPEIWMQHVNQCLETSWFDEQVSPQDSAIA